MAVRVPLTLLSLGLLSACYAQVGEPGSPGANPMGMKDPPGVPGPQDGGIISGPDGGIPTSGDCVELAGAAMVFGQSCASSGACHVPGGRYPDLSFAGLTSLVNAPSRGMPSETLIVPGEPDRSWLYRKITGTQGATGGLLMPIGTAEPIEGVRAIQAWILKGAPTTCTGEVPTLEVPKDPNTLNQDTLFTCTQPSTGSPARLRRVERSQWSHSAGYSRGLSNPFYAPEGNYTTYAEGVGIDSATLDLYLAVLPRAADIWSTRSGGNRLHSIYNDGMLRCMFNDASPNDACIDYYVDRVLEAGVLFRTPTPEERSHFRGFLVQELATESGPGVRRQTLQQVTGAAWMMSGALFRPELGEPVPGDPLGRRRLSNDELSISLGAVLSTHPPGSPLPMSDRPEPDNSDPDRGWLGQIRGAAQDGTIQDPAVLRRLLQTYYGGVDLERRDLAMDIDGRDIPALGEYWLAPRILGFFREWLDYTHANSAFKDTPLATSAVEGNSTAGNSFSNLQSGYYGYESTFVQQLDDTIARAVIESEANGADVYQTLLTTRLWHLPSNLSMSSSVACTNDGDCVGNGGNTVCRPEVGFCSSSSAKSVVSTQKVYGIPGNVPNTRDGRWVQVPEGARAGVLTHPAWLIAHGGNFEDDGSAILRGKWIRERLLCESVPGLELVQVEAQLVPSAPELRARDRLRLSMDEHPQGATCLGCHALMNPLGMAFEVYNHAGFLRASDHGQAPDGRTTVDNAPDPSLNRNFNDAVELSTFLAASPYARRCFIRQAFRYFMGRDETLSDACTLAAMETAFEGGEFSKMLEALVTSDTFLYRHVEGGAP